MVFIINYDLFLACQEREITSNFTNKLLQFSQNCGFEVFLTVDIL